MRYTRNLSVSLGLTALMAGLVFAGPALCQVNPLSFARGTFVVTQYIPFPTVQGIFLSGNIEQVTLDGAGNYSGTVTDNTNNVITTYAVSGTYTVATDGVITILTSTGFTFTGVLSGDGNSFVASGVTTGQWPTIIVAVRSGSVAKSNTVSGLLALNQNTTGIRNVAVGSSALYSNSTGTYNNALGYVALTGNTTGSHNTGIGVAALYSNTTGNYNNASGNFGLHDNTTGGYNNASGYGALYKNTTGSYNNAMGVFAMGANTVGSNNVAMGQYAGYNSVTGSNNIEIGSRGAAADNAVIRIGTPGTQKFTYVAGISGVNVTGGAPVVINSSGQLGVVLSSRRYKNDIHSMGDTSDRLLKLRPVTFRYKQPDENGQSPEQYGLIAEEVAQIMPELVVYNENGQPETVAYQTLAPLLLNELQKQHNQVEELQALRAEVSELRRLTIELAAERGTDGVHLR